MTDIARNLPSRHRIRRALALVLAVIVLALAAFALRGLAGL